MTTWLDRVTGTGRIRVEPMDWLAVEYLCFHIRAIDREEIFDNLPTDNPIEVAGMMFHAVRAKGQAWVAFFNGKPAAVMGVFQNFPGNWQIFSFGTAAYPRVLVAFRPYWDRMQEYALTEGMHRLECKSLADHTEAHGFLKLMGFTIEARLEKYGKKEQDYFLFRRLWGLKPCG